MPNIWTHILFAEDACNSKELSNYHGTALNLGAQGPDPFFYYQFWPWIKEGEVQEIGQTLHKERCGYFLMNLIDKAKGSSSQVLKSYIVGFITHHILDRHTHPYIHYYAGYEGSKHQKLEVIIDSIMLRKYRNKEAWKHPVYIEIDVGNSLPMEMHDCIDASIREIYPELAAPANFIQKSYQDMVLAHKILADPNQWKNKLLGNLISSYSHQPVPSQIDYLNEKHAIWYHSATNEPSTKSFLDHYEEAFTEVKKLLPVVNRYWNSDDEKELTTIKNIISNISYDTGMPLELGLENIVADPIV